MCGETLYWCCLRQGIEASALVKIDVDLRGFRSALYVVFSKALYVVFSIQLPRVMLVTAILLVMLLFLRRRRDGEEEKGNGRGMK